MLPFASVPPAFRAFFEQSTALLKYEARTFGTVQVTDTTDMRLHTTTMLDEVLNESIISRAIQEGNVGNADLCVASTTSRSFTTRGLTCA